MRYRLATSQSVAATADEPPSAANSNTVRSGHESHSRSVAKAISWRVTGTIDTFIVSLFITGKFGVAGTIAATEFLTKIALYYGHERAWSFIQWGRR